MLIPVKDDKALFRDAHSKAILSGNENDLKANLAKRRKSKEMASDIETLKEDMSQLKGMMQELIRRMS